MPISPKPYTDVSFMPSYKRYRFAKYGFIASDYKQTLGPGKRIAELKYSDLLVLPGSLFQIDDARDKQT